MENLNFELDESEVIEDSKAPRNNGSNSDFRLCFIYVLSVRCRQEWVSKKMSNLYSFHSKCYSIAPILIPYLTEIHKYAFEDAISVVQTGKFHYFLMMVIGSSLLASVNESICIGMFVPSAKCDLEFTNFEQGLLNSVGFLGVLVSSHFWGFLADTWGRKKVLQIGVLLGCVFSILSSLSLTVWTIIALRFCVGLAWVKL